MAQLVPVVCLIAGAVLFGASVRLTIPLAMWVALPLLLHASRTMPALTGTASLWIALLTSLVLFTRGLLPVQGPAAIFINAAIAATMALPFLVDRWLSSRTGVLLSALVFPLAWVAAEFLRSRLTSAATWFSIAYTQYGNLPLMQLAALTGIWGLTFLIVWFGSTLEHAWRHGFDANAIRLPVTTYAAVCGAILLAGGVRVALASTERPAIRVATLNRPGNLFMPGEITRIAEDSAPPAERERLAGKLRTLHDWFLEGSRREARAGSRLVVWPETSLLIFSEDEPEFVERARRLAADERVYLAMGMGTVHHGERLPLENKLVLIDPSGGIAVSYLKSHPVAGWEEGIMRRGDGVLPVTPTGAGRIASAICFEADFPEFIRQAARGSADLLILPVNEWKAIKELHFQMHAFRAIETGVPLVRAASSGLSTAFDPWGRVLGIADSFADGDHTLTVQVPIGRVPTLYAWTGDLFAWLCVAGVVVAMMGAGMR